MAELPSDEFLTDYNISLLQLSLPDNEQTWLYCLHESDPNSIIDLSYFLCWDSAFNYKSSLVPVGGDTTSDHINAPVSLPKAKRTSERRAKLKHPKKNNSVCADDLLSLEENSTLLNTQAIQSAQLNLNCNNEEVLRIELNNTNLDSQLTIDKSSNINAKKFINNNQDTTLKNNSNSWNISEHTLIADISAPKGFMDSTVIYQTPSTDFSLFSKFNFNPNSVSTPTKKLVYANSADISFTPDNLNEPVVNNNTLEDRANNTYSVSLPDEESNDRNENINFNVTTTIPTSNTEIGKTTDVIEELGPKGTLQNTYIFEDSTAENSRADNTKAVINNTDILLSTEDNMINKLDEPLSFPYNSEADFNSTITIKSKDNDDSEEDSCYSSSSNIRSLGDMCDMSQLQPQKNSNVNCILTKTRSEDSLCLSEHTCSLRKPRKHYGSALSLETQNINQLAADRRLHQNPNYFLRKPGNQAALPNLSVLENNAKHVSMGKTLVPTRLSKIPRPQSKIPKLISKK